MQTRESKDIEISASQGETEIKKADLVKTLEGDIAEWVGGIQWNQVLDSKEIKRAYAFLKRAEILGTFQTSLIPVFRGLSLFKMSDGTFDILSEDEESLRFVSKKIQEFLLSSSVDFASLSQLLATFRKLDFTLDKLEIYGIIDPFSNLLYSALDIPPPEMNIFNLTDMVHQLSALDLTKDHLEKKGFFDGAQSLKDVMFNAIYYFLSQRQLDASIIPKLFSALRIFGFIKQDLEKNNLLEISMEGICETARTFSTVNMTSLFHSLALMGFKKQDFNSGHSSLALQVLFETVVNKSDLKGNQISMILFSLSTMEFNANEGAMPLVLSSLLFSNRLKFTLKRLREKNCTFMWALATMGYRIERPSLFQAIIEHAEKELPHMSGMYMTYLIQAIAYYGLSFSDSSKHLIAKKLAQREHPQSSLLHLLCSEEVKRLFPHSSFTNEKLIPECAIFVDIYGEVVDYKRHPQKMIIEVNGAGHDHTNDGFIYNLLRKKGYKVIPVNLKQENFKLNYNPKFIRAELIKALACAGIFPSLEQEKNEGWWFDETQSALLEDQKCTPSEQGCWFDETQSTSFEDQKCTASEQGWWFDKRQSTSLEDQKFQKATDIPIPELKEFKRSSPPSATGTSSSYPSKFSEFRKVTQEVSSLSTSPTSSDSSPRFNKSG